jgi:DNA repair protein RecO (recombination protein O)
MMRWSDDALLLSARSFGENGLLVSLLTREHGRHRGLVPGGQSRRQRAIWQSGNWLAVHWQARLAEHLGTIGGELRGAYAARWLDDAGRLAALGAACAMADLCLSEHVPHPDVFAGLLALLEGLAQEEWPSLYVHWEIGLLRALGFGLDLSACAATGMTADLGYVSPKSGRAVSRAAGEPYQDRLLPLPAFLVEGGAGDKPAVAAGLQLTGHFLERHALAPQGRRLPAARSRLVDRLRP